MSRKGQSQLITAVVALVSSLNPRRVALGQLDHSWHSATHLEEASIWPA
jgi:hypothetical protein